MLLWVFATGLAARGETVGGKSIYLQSPVAGQGVFAGDTLVIRWSSVGVDKVIIVWQETDSTGTVVKNSGWVTRPEVTTAAGHEIANTNSFAWKVPIELRTGTYVVQVFNHDPNNPGGAGTYASVPVAKSEVFRIVSTTVFWRLSWRDEFNGPLPFEDPDCYSTQLPWCEQASWGEVLYNCKEPNIASRLSKLNRCNWIIWEFFDYKNAFNSASVSTTNEGFLSLSTRYVPENEGSTNCGDVNRSEDGIRQRNACPYISGGMDARPRPLQNVRGARLFDRQRLEIRAKLSPSSKAWPALWLMPHVNNGVPWPQSGELDLLESFGSPGKIRSSLHTGDGTNHFSTFVEFTSPNGSFSDNFHVYAVEWDSPEIRFYVDETQMQVITDQRTKTRECYTMKGGEPCNNVIVDFPDSIKDGFYVILNTALWKPEVAPSPASSVPPPLQIDYVRIYSRTSSYEDRCSLGGTLSGADNCQVQAFAPNVVRPGISYWVEADPRWPGVYYRKINNACPYGGLDSGLNCQIYRFQKDQLKTGVPYWVETDVRWPGVYYRSKIAKRTVFMSCDSNDGLLHRCSVPGLILRAALTMQTSQSSCVQGTSWGYDQKSVWVTQGCRAQFKVDITDP